MLIVVYCGLYGSSFNTLKDQLLATYTEVSTADPQALQVVIVSDVRDQGLYEMSTNLFQTGTLWLRVPYDEPKRGELKQALGITKNPQVVLFSGMTGELLEANITESLSPELINERL